MDGKTCKKCGEVKLLSEFYTAKGTKDGHHGQCKACALVISKARYKKIVSPELLQRCKENYAEKSKDPEWVIRQRSQVRERRRKKIEAGIRRSEVRQPRKDADQIKVKARRDVSNAIRDGRMLRQPCLVCGCKAVSHHEDYSKPLSVHWLCSLHHMDRHVHLNAAETLKINPLSLEEQFKLTL